MRVRAGRRTCLEQKQPVEARLSCGAGLTGRYFGGQATQQEQRFDARGEDPDQFAGWFEQAMNAFSHLRLFVRLCKFMSGNHRGDRSLFSVRFCSAANHGQGICSIRIDFQLGTNGGDANGFAVTWEGPYRKKLPLPERWGDWRFVERL